MGTGRLLNEPLRRKRNATGRMVLFDDHSTTDASNLFEVTDTPLVIQLFGATGSQTVSVYSVVRGLEAPFLLDGIPIELNQTVNSAVIETAGVYRVRVTQGTRLGLTCTAHKQTVDDNPLEVPQASGVQANLPNLFMTPDGAINPTHIWEIHDKPWIFTAFGLEAGEYIETYVVYGRDTEYVEQPYQLNGLPAVLTPAITSIVLNKAGRYRFKLVGNVVGKTLVGNPTAIHARGSSNEGTGVDAVLAGLGIFVNNTNPATPIVSLSPESLISIGLADTALQPGDNISELINDVGYSTVTNHEALLGLQGGIPNEHFHLTQQQHTTLSTIGALGNGFLVHTGPSSWDIRNIQAQYSVQVANGDGQGGNPTLQLVNDATGPLPMTSYSMDATGVRGWFRPLLAESSGIMGGCQLSIGPGPQQITIATGTLVFVDYTMNPLQPVRTPLVFPGAVVTITGIASQPQTFIGINAAGTVVQQPTRFTNMQRRTIAPIGIAIHTNLSSVNLVNEEGGLSRAGISQLHDLMNAIGPMNLDGNVYSANGANRRINKSQGVWFKFGVQSLTNPLDPNTITLAEQTALVFRQRTQTGEIPGDVQDLDTTNYDVGGVVTDMSPANRFQVKRVYQFQTNATRILYGQTLYGTLEEARAAIPSQPFITEANAATNGVLRGYIIVKDGCTNLSDPTQCEFISVTKFGAPAASGASPIVSTDQLPEGTVNFYYTDARVRAAAIASSIVDGDTLHAPDGNSVFDALALKVDKTTTVTASTGLSGGGQLTGNISLSIANTGVFAATYGSSTQSVTLTVNARGQITNAFATTITPSWLNVTDKPTTLAGYGITDAALDANVVHKTGSLAETITGVKTFTDDVEVKKVGSTTTLRIETDIGQIGDIQFHASDVQRYALRKTNSENFQLKRYNTSGSLIDNTFNVDGTTGVWTFAASAAPLVGTNVMWHAGNDGAGSGLDADTVDGIQAAALALSARQIIAGVGLTGGGDLSADRTISMGTPTSLTGTTTDSVSGTTHSHAVNLVYGTNIAADLPSTYPLRNPTVGAVGAGVGYPTTIGVLLTTNADTAGNRVSQFFSEAKGGSSVPQIYLRSHHTTDGGGGWTAFHKMWHAGNDGAGSGLDADTVDGVQAAALALASNFADGTYTPSLTNITNVTGSTSYVAQYLRVGNTVTVSGKVDIDPTVAGAIEVRLSLPVATASFGNESNACGSAVNSSGVAARMMAQVGGTTIRIVSGTDVDEINRGWYYNYTYRIQ